MKRETWNTFHPNRDPALAGTPGAGGMAPPTTTRISARLKRAQEHSSPVIVVAPVLLLFPMVRVRGSSGEDLHRSLHRDFSLTSGPFDTGPFTFAVFTRA